MNIRNILFLIPAFLLLYGCTSSSSKQQLREDYNATRDMINKYENNISETSSMIVEKKVNRKFIDLSSSNRVKYLLNQITKFDNNLYMFKGKDLLLDGVEGYKAYSFSEFQDFVNVTTEYDLVVKKNRYILGKVKIIELVPKETASILDDITFDSDNAQIPTHLFKELGKYAKGWKILDNAGAKEVFNTQQYINFEGTLKEFVNYFATNNNLFVDYNYRTKVIRLAKYKRRFFNLNFNSEKFKYAGKIGIDFSDVGNTGATTKGIDITDESDNAKAIIESIESVMGNKESKEEYWTLLKGSGKLVVNTTPKKLEAISELMEAFNKDALKQVYVKVTVIETKLDSQFNYGIDWGYVSSSLTSVTAGMTNGIVPSLDSALGGNSIFKIASTNGLNSVLNLMNKFGKSSIYRQIPAITTNKVPIVYNFPKVEGYVKEFTISTGSLSNTTKFAPRQGSITSGEYIYIKPTIFNSKIMLSLKISMSNVVLNKQEFQDGQYIQTPSKDKKLFSQTIILNNSEKIIIGGIIYEDTARSYDGVSPSEDSWVAPLMGEKGKLKMKKEITLIIEVKELA